MPEVTPEAYYRAVAAYYDADAPDFLTRAQANPVLRKLREDFRRITERRRFRSALEIGCGPGLDLLHFARKFPEREILGIDVSPEMVRCAERELRAAGVQNAEVRLGTLEDLGRLFPCRTFDMIYCYFGALNTVYDLEQAAALLRAAVADQGALVLTFVNRWYAFDVLWNLARVRPRQALARATGAWKGYSPTKKLASTPRSAREITRSFGGRFRIVERRGYCIAYPAWYRARLVPPGSRRERILWRVDGALNRTPAWSLGEYSLYVLEPRAGA